MARSWLVLVTTLTLITLAISQDGIKKRGKKRKPHNNIWEEEQEQEIERDIDEYEHTNSLIMTKKRDNKTFNARINAMRQKDIVDKPLNSAYYNEKIMKKLESINFKLNRLDIEVHDKTDALLKYLSEMTNVIRSTGQPKNIGILLSDIKTDVMGLRSSLSECRNSEAGNCDDKEHRHEGKTGVTYHGHLMSLDQSLRTLMEGMDVITGHLSELKNQNKACRNKPVGSNDSVGTMDAVTLISEIRRTLQDQRTKKCNCKSEQYPSDCYEILLQGFNISGIYRIKPDDYEPFYALCDLATANGGWTVFQNRVDGSQEFFNTWSEYKHGFGNLAGDFWLGLEKLYYLTNQKLYELRVEVETQQGQYAYAGFSVFSLGPEHEGYRISTLGTYYGTAGDSLSYHAGQKFSTTDMDNDDWKNGSCALEHGGAWWYKKCDKSNLNGRYVVDNEDDYNKDKSMYWISFKMPSTPLGKSRMMIRPLPPTSPTEHEGIRVIHGGGHRRVTSMCTEHRERDGCHAGVRREAPAPPKQRPTTPALPSKVRKPKSRPWARGPGDHRAPGAPPPQYNFKNPKGTDIFFT